MASPTLHAETRRLLQAQRQHGAVTGAGWGIVAALLLGALLALITRLFPLWHRPELLRVLAGVFMAATALGGVVGWIYPLSQWPRLRQLDRRLHLAERLTTAWELEAERITAPPEMTRQQQAETLQVLQQTNPRPAFPLRPSRAAAWLMAALTLILLPLVLLPNPQEAELARREALQQAAEAEAEALEQTAAALRDNEVLDPETREAALQALQEALNVLRDQGATSEERQQALTEAERQLAELHTPEAAARVQHLAEAAPLSAETIVQPLAEALAAGDLESAAAYLRGLTDTEGTPLTPEETLAIADALNQMADALQATEPGLAEQFRQIAQEVYTGDAQGAREALDRAADTLAEAGEANAPNAALEAAQAQVQGSSDRLGKTQAQAAADAASGQQAGSQQGNAAGGQQAGGQQAGGQQGNQSGQMGPGTSGHHEDSGSSAPYGDETAARLEAEGGEITLPRETAEGLPRLTTGAIDTARVPYREIYAAYAEAAEADLSRRSLPPALRNYVRDYFGGLEEQPAP